jgi:DNA-binding response OmpR family regulator
VRVLVIEDDDRIASFIVNGLKQAGFATDHSANGEDGLQRAATEHYDAAVVDLMLPRVPRSVCCGWLRAHQCISHSVAGKCN